MSSPWHFAALGWVVTDVEARVMTREGKERRKKKRYSSSCWRSASFKQLWAGYSLVGTSEFEASIGQLSGNVSRSCSLRLSAQKPILPERVASSCVHWHSHLGRLD